MIYAKGETVSYTGSTKELLDEMATAVAKVTEGAAAMMCLGSVSAMERSDCEDIFVQQVIDGAKARLARMRQERRRTGD